MNLLQNLAREIVALKMRSDNMESDFEPEKSAEWYEYALGKGMVEMLFCRDKLTGFLETIRMDYVPKTLDDLKLSETGNVAFVCNCVAGSLKDLLKMKRRAIARHMDCETFVWHSKKDDEFIVRKNMKTRYAKIR